LGDEEKRKNAAKAHYENHPEHPRTEAFLEGQLVVKIRGFLLLEVRVFSDEQGCA
jgi:hypothetical protein